MFIEASITQDAEKGQSASFVFFVIMGNSCWRESHNDAMSVDERFSFSIL
jgi:hypothetical protein